MRLFKCAAVLFGGWVVAFGMEAWAEVTLPSILGSNMTLQRGMSVPIWGWAEPGEEVRVEFDGQRIQTRAGADGNWRVDLEPLEAGGPDKMRIRGENTIELENVLVGEVWVASGQSNMEWPVNRSNNADQEIASATHPRIRLFSAKRTIASQPQSDVVGEWVECNPNTIPDFSAVAYFFGRKLHKDMEVPIGLVKSAWGGTPSEAWTKREYLETPVGRPLLDRWDKELCGYASELESYEEEFQKWRDLAAETEKKGDPVVEEPSFPRDPRRNAHRYAGLFNGMINPLIPFAMRGVIWYQGESNANRAYQYRTLFPAMIRCWRDAWGQGDFPLLFVQLANFYEPHPEPRDHPWAELREAQTMALELPNTGMAVTIDIGEADDIHPRNKQDVGKRLALAAEKIAYGKDVAYSGPIFDSMKIEGNKARIHFNHVGDGLKVGGDQLEGFAIADPDRKFHWASARIEGDGVVVSSDDVKDPVAVRYAWDGNPKANLYNQAGLPASPFRTDDWPGATIDAR